MAVTIKDIKDLNWSMVKISKAAGFDGGVKVFKNAEGQEVAMLVALEDVFLVADDVNAITSASAPTLWKADEIAKDIVRNRDVDIEDYDSLTNTISIGWLNIENNDLSTAEAGFNEELLEKLGLNDYSIKEELRDALVKIADMHKLTDLPLG